MITEIHVAIARTINLGNFESLRIEGSLTAAVGQFDSVPQVKAQLQVELRALMEETYLAQHKAKTAPRPTAPAPRQESDPPPGSFRPATPDPEY